MINGGIYLFEPKIFEEIPSQKKVSLEEEIFPKLAKEGRLSGKTLEGYFVDIGRPETYHQFKRDIIQKIIMGQGQEIREAMQKITQNRIDLILINMDRYKYISQCVIAISVNKDNLVVVEPKFREYDLFIALGKHLEDSEKIIEEFNLELKKIKFGSEENKSLLTDSVMICPGLN